MKDVASICLDFLEARDLFGRAMLTSRALRAAASSLPGRISLETFSSISATLDDEWRMVDESDSEADDEWWYDAGSAHCSYELLNCSITRYILVIVQRGDPPCFIEAGDLKDLVVIERPDVTFVDSTKYEAPNGRYFTVGALFDAIARNEALTRGGPMNEIYFEGLERHRGRYGAAWGE